MSASPRYLLDTNVVSELVKTQPESRVLAFLADLTEGEALICSMTLAELERGIVKIQDSQPQRAQYLRDWQENQVVRVYGPYILPFDELGARAWGQLVGSQAARRQPPSLQDSIIAATAYAHRLTLVTRNTADFQAFPIAVFNPWKDDQ